MYLTYSEYTSMGGTRPRGVFDRINFKAQTLISGMTHCRILSETPVRDPVRYATFEVVQAMIDDQESGADAREIASMSNDGVTVSYTATGLGPRARYANIVRGYLEAETDANGTPLLYAGVDA